MVLISYSQQFKKKKEHAPTISVCVYIHIYLFKIMHRNILKKPNILKMYLPNKNLRRMRKTNQVGMFIFSLRIPVTALCTSPLTPLPYNFSLIVYLQVPASVLYFHCALYKLQFSLLRKVIHPSSHCPYSFLSIFLPSIPAPNSTQLLPLYSVKPNINVTSMLVLRTP